MRTIVVIPAYNEEKTLGAVFNGVVPLANEIAVVNDGSTDSTETIARNHSGCVVLTHFINRGLGAAIRTGFEYAQNSGADFVITFDADGQHNPNDIPRLQEMLMQGLDVVIGSRMKGERGMPLHRRIANYIGNLVTQGGAVTTDSQSGLRAFRVSALKQFQLFGDRMEISSEIISEIARLKLRYGEISIAPVYTPYSLSKGQNFFVGVVTLCRLVLRKLLK